MKKSEKTKQKILTVTINLIAKRGYASTSTREIAEQADVSEATIFKYYKSKDKLLKTIVIQTMEKLFKSSSEKKLSEIINKNKSKNPEIILKTLLEERFNFFDEHKNELKVIFQEMLINKKVQNYFKEEIWSKMVKISDGLFKQIKNKCTLKEEIDGYMFRKTLFGMIFFTILFENILEDNINLDSNKQATLISNIIFDGISF
ncbi:MAG: TetR/AcrR family transcriptional regulator [Halanaerobiales bacterium]|nr:TetR/AcrR family transcriptional regulator [Halanaerobiales bacterium]